MTARELIRDEAYKAPPPHPARNTALEFQGLALSAVVAAAERVIERLLKDCATLSANYEAAERRAKAAEQRVEELLAERMEAAKVSADYKREREREAYRARLDAMVAAFVVSPRSPFAKQPGKITVGDYMECATGLLAAIDAHVAGRK